MAANMIGVSKRIIAFDNEGTYMVMFNPENRKVFRSLRSGGGLSVPHRNPKDQAVEVHQDPVSERAVPDPF